MAVSNRPGGLTAMAVFNFVFGGIAILVWLVTMAQIGSRHERRMEQQRQRLIEPDFVPASKRLKLARCLLGLAYGGLLIASGVGYLLQKRGLGKTLGLLFVLTCVGQTLVNVILVDKRMGPLSLWMVVYTVMTVIVLFTVFKDDFPN